MATKKSGGSSKGRESGESSAKKGGASASGESESARAGAIEQEEPASMREEVSDEDFEEDPEIDSLLGLALMDAEAASAYEIVAELVEDPLARTLRGFAEDHRRHVDDIGRVLARLGHEGSIEAPDPSTSVFAMLASAMGNLGSKPAVLALIANEEFTNATYDTTLDLVTDEEARKVLERNFADEQRHLRFLVSQRDEAIDRLEESAEAGA